MCMYIHNIRTYMYIYVCMYVHTRPTFCLNEGMDNFEKLLDGAHFMVNDINFMCGRINYTYIHLVFQDQHFLTTPLEENVITWRCLVLITFANLNRSFLLSWVCWECGTTISLDPRAMLSYHMIRYTV